MTTIDLFSKIKKHLLESLDRQRIAIGMSRGAAMMHARRIDLTAPETWEFSGFSQNGEDGILDVLRRQLKSSNRYFVEIGASDGIENNSGWLVMAEKYNGILVEGDPKLVDRSVRSVNVHSIGAESVNMFVTRDTVPELAKRVLHDDPDVFSLDIDGNDYFIAEALFAAGLRPRIFVVEYNSVYGPEQSLSVSYREDFVFTQAHPTHLYYGVSVTAWRRFFESRGYRFVTVDRNGVNAFFVDPAHFDAAFLDGVRGTPWRENQYQLRMFRIPSDQQFALIADQNYVHVE